MMNVSKKRLMSAILAVAMAASMTSPILALAEETGDEYANDYDVASENDAQVFNDTDIIEISAAESDDPVVEEKAAEPQPADTTRLDALIAAAEGLDRTQYTNYLVVVEALSEARALLQRDGLCSDDQGEIDEAVLKLQDAINALQYKPISKDELEEAIEEVEELNPDMYTDSEQLEGALNQAKRLDSKVSVDLSDQNKIQSILQTIRETVPTMTFKLADYGTVRDLQDEINELDLTVYTDDSLEDLEYALDDIEEGLDVQDQDKVDDMATAIRDAIDALEPRSADLSSIKNLAATAAELKQEDYPDKDFAAVTNALADVTSLIRSESKLEISDLPEIMKCYGVLINAVNALKSDVADYSDVIAAIEAAGEVQRNLYTSESLIDLDNEISAVTFGFGVSQQTKVDTMAEDIENAIFALVLKTANYGRVNDAKITADAVSRDLYTSSSLAALDTAISSVKEKLDVRYQEDVNDMATAILDAVEGLAYKPSNTSVLSSMVQTAELLDSRKFIDFTAVDSALRDAQSLLNGDTDIRDQETIDTAAQALKDAIDALELMPNEVDLRYLAEMIARAEDMDKTQYADFSGVESALAEARALMNDSSLTSENQADANAAAKVLEDAISALSYVTADYSDVDDALYEAERVDRDKYTEDSLNVLDDAVDAVVRDKSIEEQDEVDAMAAAILNAIDSLVLDVADTSKLETAVERAEKLNEKDYEDFRDVEDALDDANAILREKDLQSEDQSRIDKATKTLRDAMADLKRVSKDTGNGNSGSSGNNNNDNNNNQGGTSTQTPESSATPNTPDRIPAQTGVGLGGRLVLNIIAICAVAGGLCYFCRKRREDM